MSEFTQFLADCWRMYTDVQVPVLNISFAQLWLGIFVVGVSIMILRPLLGIGAGGVNNIIHGLARKHGYDHAYSKHHQSSNSSWKGTKVVSRNNNVSIHSSRPPRGFN